MKRKNPILAHIVAILVVGIWGTTFVSTKSLLFASLEPADIFFYRFCIAYLCTLFFYHKRLFARTFREELLMLLLGVCGGSLYFLTENHALEFAQASDVSIIVSSCPILTSILLAAFYRSERINLKQTIGLIIGFVGIVLVIMNGHFNLHVSPLGYALALCSALSWAFYSLFSKRVLHKYSPWFINRKVFFYGILTILPYYVYAKPLNTDTTILFLPKVMANLIFLGVIANMVCYVVWMWVMKSIGVVKANIYGYLNPLFTIITAAILLGERMTWMAFLGTFILISGVYLTQKRKNK